MPLTGAMVRRATVRTILVLAAATLVLMAFAPTGHAAARQVNTTSAAREAAAAAALQAVGSPYHPGSAGPRRFDCSGLVTWAYRLAGAPLSGRSSHELVTAGARISRSALAPGDLVWTWDRTFGHVGIYVGDGRYVHAPGKGRRVEVAPLPKGPALVLAVRP